MATDKRPLIREIDVKNGYASWCTHMSRTDSGGKFIAGVQGQAEFDRWLESHDREVAARTLNSAAETFEWAGEDADYAAFRGWLRQRALDEGTGRAAGFHAASAATGE